MGVENIEHGVTDAGAEGLAEGVGDCSSEAFFEQIERSLEVSKSGRELSLDPVAPAAKGHWFSLVRGHADFLGRRFIRRCANRGSTRRRLAPLADQVTGASSSALLKSDPGSAPRLAQLRDPSLRDQEVFGRGRGRIAK
jgi:hypothetical protein